MQFPCPATQRKSSSLKSTYTVCEDSFANLKASLVGKWAVRSISRDRRADRQHFYTPRDPAGVGRHTQTWQPPAALLRPLGAAGCGTIPLPCWSWWAWVAAVLPAGAGKQEQSLALPLLPGWSHWAHTDKSSTLCFSEAGVCMQSRHFPTTSLKLVSVPRPAHSPAASWTPAGAGAHNPHRGGHLIAWPDGQGGLLSWAPGTQGFNDWKDKLLVGYHPQGTAQTADWNTAPAFLWKRPIYLKLQPEGQAWGVLHT